MRNLPIRLVLSFWLPPLGVLLTVYNTKNRSYWHWINLLINVALFLTLPIVGKLHAIWLILYEESPQKSSTQQPFQSSYVPTIPPNSPPISQRVYHWVSTIMMIIGAITTIMLGLLAHDIAVKNLEIQKKNLDIQIQRQIHPDILQETHSKKY